MLFIVLVVFAVLLAYLLNTPVPKGITDPHLYRRLLVGVKLYRFIVACLDFFRPGGANDIMLLRYFTEHFQPKPVSKVKGSKFKAMDTTFDGVKVRVYQPIHEKKMMTGFIFIHGGGYCIGSSAMYDLLTREFADHLDSVVVSIDYRLAPEYVFPAQHEDCITASRWFISNATKFSVNPVRIGIGGDSAGGCLAALVAQNIHDDRFLPDLRVQALIYPGIQIVDSNTPSYQKYQHEFGDCGVLPKNQISRWLSYFLFGKQDIEYQNHYHKNTQTSSEMKKILLNRDYLAHDNIPLNLRDQSFYTGPTDEQLGNDDVWERIQGKMLDPRMGPLNRVDFSGLPTAYIVTCGFDPIRDDGILYARALETAGVDVTWKHYEAGFHGVFSPELKFKLGDDMRKEALEFIKSKL